MIGKQIHELASRLFPLNRSITGEGVRQTLKILKDIVPELEIKDEFEPYFDEFYLGDIQDACFGLNFHWHLMIARKKGLTT